MIVISTVNTLIFILNVLAILVMVSGLCFNVYQNMEVSKIMIFLFGIKKFNNMINFEIYLENLKVYVITVIYSCEILKI